ncbi:MAG: M24 family metallopeptidase [Candidatus Helarchaeota archaeon]
MSVKNRIEKLKDTMSEMQVKSAVLFNSRNIFYFSGTAQHSICVIPVDGDPILFIRRNFERAVEESPIREKIILKSTRQIFDKLSELNCQNQIGLELDSLSTSQFLRFKKVFPDSNFTNLSQPIKLQRSIKDAEELELLRKSAKVGERVQTVCREMLRPGITELDLAGEIQREITRHGSIFAYFNHYWARTPFIIASGENLWARSDFPPVLCGVGASKAEPHGPSHRVIKDGDIVVVDVATVVNGYTSDHARTYFVGKTTRKYLERHEALLKARNAGISAIREGTTPQQLYKIMEKELPKGLVDYFQGFGDDRVGLGHGIGLALDDLPFLVRDGQEPLRAGNVIAFEPKIIIPEWGAIDFEDDLIVKKDQAPEVMTNSPI